MAAFVTDSFTDTNGVVLTSHAGELGATWARHNSASNTNAPEVNANSIRTFEANTNANYYASGAPTGADYSAYLEYTYNGNLGSVGGPGIRLETGASTGYFAIVFKPGNTFAIYKYVASGSPALVASISFSPVAAETYKITLTGAGTSLVAKVQRASDNFWLTSASAFQAAAANAITTTDSSITAAGRAGFWFSNDSTASRGTIDNFSADQAVGAATGITMSGPTTGTVGVASTNFSIGVTPVGGTITGTVVVTPSDGGVGGTFTPTTVSLTTAAPTATFTYTPASVGAKTISVTNNGSLTNPANITYTATSGAATAVTMSGPSSGTVSVASTNFTIGANGTITGTVVVTPSDAANGGTFTPTTVSISSGTPTATFTYTPASTGVKTISITNNGGLTNPSNISYTSNAASLFTQVNATDTVTGQNIMILVPAAGSANPYNAGVPTGVIMYVHGANETQTGLITETIKFACRDALINAGYILAGTNAHGNNWGNQISCDDYPALEKYLRANYNVKNVALWAQSMGGLDGLSVLAQAKIKLVGILLTYPVVSLANLYALGAFTAAIEGAYGITGTGNATYANLTYGQDPALKNGFSYRHVPMRMYASAGDTVVPKAQNSDVLAAAVAGSCRESTLVVCTGDHGDATHFQPSDYVSFFNRCFATPVADGQPLTSRNITIRLVDAGGSPALPNLTGLKWSWSDQLLPHLREYPTDKGSVETTDANGDLQITVKTNLPVSGVGYLEITNSDGSPLSSTFRALSGPVTVT